MFRSTNDRHFGYRSQQKNWGCALGTSKTFINSPLCYAHFSVSPPYIVLHGVIHHFLADSPARHGKNLEIPCRKTIRYKNPLEVDSQRG